MNIVIAADVAADDRAFLVKQFPLLNPANSLTIVEAHEANTHAECLTLFVKENRYVLQNAQGLCLDLSFHAGEYLYRQTTQSKEPLLHAIKIKQKLPQTVIDSTAGVLKDSLLMASRGINVIAYERHPLLFIMVQQSLRDLAIHNPTLHARIHYQFGDSRLLCTEQPADLVYLDPMFPESKKSAKTKKDMQFLQSVIGQDADACELLACALSSQPRVVVKRPANAPCLLKKPNHQLQIKKIRYDIYLA